VSVGGRTVEARLVYHGERFGPGRRNVYQGYRPCVEITRVRALPGSAYLNSFSGELLSELLAPYPTLPLTKDGSFRLPPQEVRRLVEWVEDPDEFQLTMPVGVLVAAADGRADVIATELPEQHYTPEIALDGDQALRIAGERQPEVVIAEATLARVDGYQLARELRRVDATSRAVYVLIGADPHDDEAFLAGANACLPWPLDMAELRTTLAELLGLV